MRLILDGETHLRLVGGKAGLEVEAAEPGIDFSPLHMLAASLATCTYAVLATWALQAGLGLDDLEIELAWDYVEDPYRVGRYGLEIRWPSLPDARRTAALRVARHCTVEHTLTHPPEIAIELSRS